MVVVFVDGKEQKCGGSGGGKVIEMWWGGGVCGGKAIEMWLW